MSIMRFVGAVAISASMLTGCQGPQAQDETGQVAQSIRVITQPNSSLASGGMVAEVIPALGIRHGYLMTTDNLAAASIVSMKVGSQTVTSLTAPAGRLIATIGSTQVTQFTASQPLIIRFASPIAGFLRIYNASEQPSYTAYTAEWSASGKGSWSAYCPHDYVSTSSQGVSNFVAEPMIPVGGARWDQTNGDRVEDSGAITLACRHDAVGGCITWGYTPWDSITSHGQTYSLSGYHQTCTRMKRFDVCGHSVPHTTLNQGTRVNTMIQLWDMVGLNDMGDQTRASMEAAWDANGAICFNPDRFRTEDQGSSYYGALMDMHQNCPNIPLCSGSSPLLYMLGSARPLP